MSALGLALSGYLSWHYVVGGSVIGCGGGSPCEQVLSSRWSAIGGMLPVSGLAEGAYLAMLIASLSIGPSTAAPVRRLAWRALLVLAGAAAGSAVWFIIVQKWMIGAFCPYCMATHITSLLLAALVVWRAPRESDDEVNIPGASPGALQKTVAGVADPGALGRQFRTPESATPATTKPKQALRNKPKEDSTEVAVGDAATKVDRWAAAGLAAIGLALAGILSVCQVSLAPAAVSRSGQSQDTLPALDPHAVPLVGSPNASSVVTLLFDYNCPHCQQVHAMLEEAIRRFDGKLAFALCPAPLNNQCNPYIPQNVDEFKDSCELAKLGLAVWLASREAFSIFDRWMYSVAPGERWHPRSLDAARAKAVELVGQAKFAAARADPWIDQYLQTSLRIYGHTLQGGNAVPKLVFGPHWVIPEPNNPDELVQILHDRLAVPGP